MPLAEGRHYAFSCGSQYMDWTAANCEQCQKYDEEAVRNLPYSLGCDIADVLLRAGFDDGSVSEDAAKRMGLLAHEEDYCWDCPERVLSEVIDGD